MISRIFSAILAYKWKILAVAAVLIALRCLWLWQPERQVRLHEEHFLKAAQEGNWTKYYGFFDDNFRTPNGQDKVWALQMSREVLKQFIVLGIRETNTTISMEGGTGRLRTLLRIDGSGMELAEMAKRAVNESQDPFEFTWKHESWKPWDWRLTGVDHPLLHVSGDLQ
jgi:hypothetical protein